MHWKGLEVNKKVLRCFLKSNSRSFGTLFSTFLKSENMSSHQLNSNNNDPVLLVKTIFRHCTCFLSSVATDGTDERIIIRFWETAHLPLPYTNINAYFSLRAKYLLREGLGGHRSLGLMLCLKKSPQKILQLVLYDEICFRYLLNRAFFVWPWNENARTKQKQQTNGNWAIW